MDTEPSASLEFIGTATTILRLGPFTLLTDPNFLRRGQRAYLGNGLWSKRLTEPSLGPDDLPSLDAVLLSHLHGDHFDRVSRRGLVRHVPLLTTRSAAPTLRRWGFQEARGLAPWQEEELQTGDWSLRVLSTPGVHAPGLARKLLPAVMGSVLELRHLGRLRHRTYITGDTLYRPWLREIVERTGPLDAVVLHVGGTRILGMLLTMDDRQAADLVALIEPRVSVPVHYDDYGVFRSPLGDLVDRWADRRLPGVLRTVERGDRVSLT